MDKIDAAAYAFLIALVIIPFGPAGVVLLVGLFVYAHLTRDK
jgi:hypothetical protein